jgi:DNA-binding MarR family transcriptional regulator
MAMDHRKTTIHRLAQAAHSYRVYAGARLSRIGLHYGQEALLKALADNNGQSMSELAAALAVQPPTVTKMINRLAARGYVERRASKDDGRQAYAHLTKSGRKVAAGVDKVRRKLEKDTLAGFSDSDQKRLRKLLRQVSDNLEAARDRDANKATKKTT